MNKKKIFKKGITNKKQPKLTATWNKYYDYNGLLLD